MTATVRVSTYTQSVTYVSEGIVNLLDAIVRKLGLSNYYISTYKDSLLRGLSTWLDSEHLEQVFLVVEDRWRSEWAAVELKIEYLQVGRTSAFYDDLEAARYETAKLGAVPPGATYRIVVRRKPGAPDVPGWGPGPLPTLAGMQRSRVGGAVGAPDIEASLVFWSKA